MKNQIYPCLWFDGYANEAAKFYCSVFKESKITTDTSMVVEFELGGQKFMGLNGGPQFTPNPSISFFVVCETEQEVETAWGKLSENGNVLMPLNKYEWSDKYGWIQDRFGVSWQLAYGKLKDVGQRFTPSLMFTNQQAGKAEAAIHFYTSVFKDASVTGIAKYTAEDGDVEGTVKHAQFSLNKNVFMAMDSSLSHSFEFNEGISLAIACENQSEIDHYWAKLSEGGEESMCGWLKDHYGVSWQVIPAIIGKLMNAPKKGQAVMNEILQMTKIDINRLVQAYERG